MPLSIYFEGCLNGRLLRRQWTDLNIKWKEFIKIMPSLTAVLYSLANVHSGTASKLEPFSRLVKVFKLTLLIIFAKVSS